MKSLVKAAALLVVAMPLYAADMTTSTTTNGTTAAPAVDCSKLMGAAQDKCMKDLATCNSMTVAADKSKCMADMNKSMANSKDMGSMNKSMDTMNKNMDNMNKNAQ